MPEDTFRYKVELDTQGLAGQLAGVRDVVAQGLGQVGQGIQAGAQIAAGAVNRLSSDLMQGQQFIAAALPSQMMSMVPPIGGGLADVPGMPQTFMQEVRAGFGIERPPVGVFPSQFQQIGRQRLQERIAMGTAEGISTLGITAGSMAIGAMVGGPAGAVVGLGVGMLGDVAMRPVIDAVHQRMTDRAQIQNIFGFNKFSDDNRMVMTDFMRQRFTKSIFSPEEFNTVMPAAARAGFFRGVGRNDVAGFRGRFAEAEQTLAEDMYSLQVTGPEGIMAAAEARRGLGRMGVTDQRAISRHFRQARVISQDMAELGEFADPQEVIQQQVAAGSTAMQFGLSARSGMETFSRQASMVNRLRAQGQMSDDDLAALGGGTAEAANRLTSSLMASQRHPVFRAAALAFGDMSGGIVGVNRAAMESGGMSFASMTERLSQQLGTGAGGTTKMMTLMANQGKIQSDMMANQGQMLRGMTDDILRQANMEVTDGTRQFMMQRVFGVGEAESRVLAAGLPMEKADEQRLQKDANQFDREVKGAIQQQQTGVAHGFEEFTRDLKETLAKPLDHISNDIARKLVPSIDKAVEHLDSLDRRTGGTRIGSHSPLTVGPIDFTGSDGSWMVPADPMSMHGFRAVRDSRMFPAPMVSMQAAAPKVAMLPRMSNPMKESMAG